VQNELKMSQRNHAIIHLVLLGFRWESLPGLNAQKKASIPTTSKEDIYIQSDSTTSEIYITKNREPQARDSNAWESLFAGRSGV